MSFCLVVFFGIGFTLQTKYWMIEACFQIKGTIFFFSYLPPPPGSHFREGSWYLWHQLVLRHLAINSKNGSKLLISITKFLHSTITIGNRLLYLSFMILGGWLIFQLVTSVSVVVFFIFAVGFLGEMSKEAFELRRKHIGRTRSRGFMLWNGVESSFWCPDYPLRGGRGLAWDKTFMV